MSVVFSTDNFQKLIQKYGLTPAEFLRPFGILTEETRGSFSNFTEDPMITLKHMRLNFYNNWDLEEINQATVQETLKHILDNYQPTVTLEDKDWTNQAAIEESLLFGPTEGCTPWFAKWREFHLETARFSHHELVD